MCWPGNCCFGRRRHTGLPCFSGGDLFSTASLQGCFGRRRIGGEQTCRVCLFLFSIFLIFWGAVALGRPFL